MQFFYFFVVRFSFLYHIFKYGWLGLDIPINIPIKDDVCYERTKSYRQLGDSELVSQRYFHKECRLMFITYFHEKKKNAAKNDLINK